MFISGLGWGAASILVPLYGDELGGGLTIIGFIWTIYSLPRAAFSPVFGRLSDFFGNRKNFISLGLIFSGVFFLLIPILGMILTFVLLRALQGVALSSARPVASSLASQEKKSKGRAKALGLFDTARTVGRSISPALIGFLLQYFGFTTPFVLSGSFTILAGILVFFTISPDYGARPTKESDWIERLKRSTSLNVKKLPGKLKKALTATVKSPLFPILVLIFLRFVGRHTYSRFIPIYFDDLGFSEGHIGILRSFRSGASAALMLLSGALADRIGRRPLLLFAVFCAGLEPFLLYWEPGFIFAFFIYLVGSMGWGVFIPAARAVIADLSKKTDRGGAYGSMSSAMLLGISIGPIMGGAIADALGFRFDLLFSAGLLGIILVLFFYFLEETLED